MSPELYVFDMDFTLLDVDSSTYWCRYLVEKGIVKDPNFLQQEAALMQQYDAGTMDVHDYIAFSMGVLSQYTAEQIEAWSDQYAQEVLSQHVYPEARALISSLQQEGARILVISASAAFIVRSAAALLGIKKDQVIAVEIECQQEFYGTKIHGHPPFQGGKVDCLKAWQQAHGLEQAVVHFWTDSSNDLPLCRYADHAWVVNPSASFAEQAKQLGFPILHWGANAGSAQD